MRCWAFAIAGNCECGQWTAQTFPGVLQITFSIPVVPAHNTKVLSGDATTNVTYNSLSIYTPILLVSRAFKYSVDT